MDLSFNDIQSLIINAAADGNRMYCEFQAPGSDEVVASEAPVRRIRSVKGQVTRVVKRNMANQARRMASRMLRDVLGSGFVGRTGSMVFNTSTREATRDFTNAFTREEEEAAIVEAFLKVSDRFTWDDSTGKWGAAGRITSTLKEEARTPFAKQLQTAPLRDAFEREVLARILVELAASDGEISEDEHAFLDAFLEDNVGSVEDLQAMGPLSRIECEELSPAVRKTVYMLAWAVALADLDLSFSEEDLLADYARMFGLEEKDAGQLAGHARRYTLEQVIDPRIPRNELHDFGRRLGLTKEEAERCLIDLKRRGGN